MKIHATPASHVPQLTLRLHDVSGNILAESIPSPYTILVTDHVYADGDSFTLSSREVGSRPDSEKGSQKGLWVWLQTDPAIQKSLVYLPDGQLRYQIHTADVGKNLPQQAFSGSRHIAYAQVATTEEVQARRCLSLNTLDQHENTSFYPHASANVETRNEAVFAAANAIDGYHANRGHGPWPYQSWGINRDPQAALTIDLGVPCLLDEIRLTIRTDFPHDSYWTSVDLRVDSGEVLTLAIEKTSLPQIFHLAKAAPTRTVVLENLIQADDPSPFPALTQLELWGVVQG